MGSNKSGMLLITGGNSYFIDCRVVVLSPKSLCISLPLSKCNHIPNTTGFQSNHTHRNPLIKLICGDPHLPFRPQSNAPPIPPYQHVRYSLIGSCTISSNATQLTKCYS